MSQSILKQLLVERLQEDFKAYEASQEYVDDNDVIEWTIDQLLAILRGK